MKTTFQGELEIDSDRGVIYFHLTDKKDIESLGTMTLLRICQLPKPIPTNHALDITHMHGADWRDK